MLTHEESEPLSLAPASFQGGAFLSCRPPIRNLVRRRTGDIGKVFAGQVHSNLSLGGYHMNKSAGFRPRLWHEGDGPSAIEIALWLATIAAGLAVGSFLLL